MDVDETRPPPPAEGSLPPRLRKTWIAKSAERLRRGESVSPAQSGEGGVGESMVENVKDESYFGMWSAFVVLRL